MARSQRRSVRKPSGGRYHSAIKKKKRDLARPPALTSLGEERKKTIRTRGGNRKIRLQSYQYANISSPEKGTTDKVEIEDVEDNYKRGYYPNEKRKSTCYKQTRTKWHC